MQVSTQLLFHRRTEVRTNAPRAKKCDNSQEMRRKPRQSKARLESCESSGFQKQIDGEGRSGYIDMAWAGLAEARFGMGVADMPAERTALTSTAWASADGTELSAAMMGQSCSC
jgi:hypothetical protein